MILDKIKKYVLICSVVYPILGCAQQSGLQEGTIEKEFNIPNNYDTLKHKDLVSLLHPSINCEGVDFRMPKERYLVQIPLEGNKEILATVCEPGAYQDHHITYLITKKGSQSFARKLGWLEPVFEDNQWKLAPTYIMAGPMEVDKESGYFINMRLYVSHWTCGFNAYYSLPLSNDKFIKPDRVEADNDCDNGIRYDGWPEIDVSKMEVLSKYPVYNSAY